MCLHQLQTSVARGCRDRAGPACHRCNCTAGMVPSSTWAKAASGGAPAQGTSAPAPCSVVPLCGSDEAHTPNLRVPLAACHGVVQILSEQQITAGRQPSCHRQRRDHLQQVAPLCPTRAPCWPPILCAHIVLIKYGQAADVEFVRDALRSGKGVKCSELPRLHRPHQVFAQPQRVQAKVDLDAQVDNVQRCQLLVFVACRTRASRGHTGGSELSAPGAIPATTCTRGTDNCGPRSSAGPTHQAPGG